MSYPPLVSDADLARHLGVTFDTADSTRAAEILRQISAEVRKAARTSWVDTAGDLEEVPEDVRSEVLQAAATLWANPTGAAYQTAGPFAVQYGEPLTDDARERLRRDYAGTSGGIGTISTTRGDMETPSVRETWGEIFDPNEDE